MTPLLTKTLCQMFRDAVLADMGYPALTAKRRVEAEAYRGEGLGRLGLSLLEAERREPLSIREPGVATALMRWPVFREFCTDLIREAVGREFDKIINTASIWTRPRRVTRFADITFETKMAKLPKLLKVGNAGELEADPLGAPRTVTRTADTYAATWGLPRQSLFGRDVAELADIAVQMAEIAHNTLTGLVYDELLSNSAAGPTMGEDSQALFYARTTPNLMTGATSVLSESSFQTAAGLLRNITTADGRKRNLGVRYLLVPTALEMTALALRTKLGLGPAGSVGGSYSRSPVARFYDGPLGIIVEPALDDVSTTGWYILADERVQGVELVALMQDRPRPLVEPVELDTMLGLGFRLILDAGVLVNDWRAIVRSAGA